jgi:hypothetical protein
MHSPCFAVNWEAGTMQAVDLFAARRILRAAVLAGAVILMVSGMSQAQPQYTVYDIPLPVELTAGCEVAGEITCPDGPPCQGVVDNLVIRAHGLNRHGQVVGIIDFKLVLECQPETYAFVWLPKPAYGLGAGTHFLRTPTLFQFHKSFANDINDDGIVVGREGDPPDDRGMWWDLRLGTPGLIGNVLPVETREAFGVTNVEDNVFRIVGNAVHMGSDVAFRWTSATQVIEHFSPPNPPVGMRWSDAGAYDTNANGLIGGWARGQAGQGNSCQAIGDAAAWTPQGLHLAQPDVPGSTFRVPRDASQEIDGEVRGINATGNLVGWAREHVSGVPLLCIDKAMFWQDTGATGVELPAPLETKETLADAVDVQGSQSVGSNVSDQRAVLWRKTSAWAYHDLNDLVVPPAPPAAWQLRSATDINVFGLICGYGDYTPPMAFPPDTTAFILVPDPCTCAGDVDGNGAVDVVDLVAVILDWDCTNPPGPCPGDANGNGVVNVEDLVLVILQWGNCGCNIFDLAPASFSQELAEGGLSSGDWDEFINNINDPNHRCWMAWHLVGGTANCPGPDPWAP